MTEKFSELQLKALTKDECVEESEDSVETTATVSLNAIKVSLFAQKMPEILFANDLTTLKDLGNTYININFLPKKC